MLVLDVRPVDHCTSLCSFGERVDEFGATGYHYVTSVLIGASPTKKRDSILSYNELLSRGILRSYGATLIA